MGLQILATGSYVPDAVVTNDHLHNRFGFNPEWIVKQTGIHERRHALDNQATSDLCVEPAQRCLEKAGVSRQDIDLLLVATVTPDMSFPSAACMVQDRLKLTCPAVDLQAACAGFIYALVTGAAYVASGASDLCLIIGGDFMSTLLNHDDVKKYLLMGDRARRLLLCRGTPPLGTGQHDRSGG